jgi:hypothetical protein
MGNAFAVECVTRLEVRIIAMPNTDSLLPSQSVCPILVVKRGIMAPAASTLGHVDNCTCIIHVTNL